jgi:hypothetical protein
MIKYAFKEEWGGLRNAAKADPQKIGETLAKLSTENGGRLMPEKVLNAAKNKSNTLHQHFEWDDAVAAHAHRLDQARTIIRAIRVEDVETGANQPAYISVADGGTAYRSVEEVSTSRELQLAVLRQAERELRTFERRYAMLRDVCELVKSARDKVEQKSSELETSAAAA